MNPVISRDDFQLLTPALREDGSPALPAIDAEKLGRTLRGQLVPPKEKPIYRGMVSRRWRLVLAEKAGRGPAPSDIRNALAPLLRLRGNEEALYYAPKESDLEDDADRWEEEHSDILYEESCTLLLAGDLHDLPFALQLRLGARHTVGRLSFPNLDDYAAYADKVTRLETDTRTRAAPGALCFGVNHDYVTTLLSRNIIRPIDKALRALNPGGGVRSLFDGHACQGDLRDALETLPIGSLVVMGSHGCEPSSWTETNLGVPFDQYKRMMTPSLFADGPCLEGGIAILMACHSAGRRGSHKEDALIQPATNNPNKPELLAPLPNALLTNPRGPLAVLGHVDRMWLYGFGDRTFHLDDSSQNPGLISMEGFAKMMMQGKAMTEALLPHKHKLVRNLQRLNHVYKRQSGRTTWSDEENRELTFAWAKWNDTRNWVVLGDPAARLFDPDAA